MDATKILTADEAKLVIVDLRRRARRSKTKHLNLIVFRLSCCCGLRCKELVGLNIGDVIASGPKPCIRVRKGITKGRHGQRRARMVPLWWDSGTLEDIAEWVAYRISQGARHDDPLLASEHITAKGKRLCGKSAQHKWTSCLRPLGPGRQRQLSIHCGRHTFCSHALNAGRSPVEVRDAAGHASLNTTSIYLHLIERDGVPDLFPVPKRRKRKQ
jgi:integrase